VAVEDVVVAATFKQVAAATTEQDVALGPDEAGTWICRRRPKADQRAELVHRCVDDRLERGWELGQRRGARWGRLWREQLVEAGDPGHACGIERVATGEPAGPDDSFEIVTMDGVI